MVRKINIEREYGTQILEILNRYSLPVKIEYVPDVPEWQKAHNCSRGRNQSCYTPAATVKESEGGFLILINKEISGEDLRDVISRVDGFQLLQETRDIIKHLILHEICHILITLNRKDGVLDDLCDIWAFSEMGLLKKG